MKFEDFYKNAERSVLDAIVSFWTTTNHEEQRGVRDLFQKESLFGKPVFQSMFPWQPYNQTFEEIDFIHQNFKQRLNQIAETSFRFPIERAPYTHQFKSWDKMINEQKSIVVTSGTGSGKTECFMIPILHEIFQKKIEDPQSRGVQALFLYPLNALIGSQQKRMHSWVNALGEGITYAVYNGKTKENANTSAINEHLPELISRNGIRERIPDILFTNPTMLEYMLVRAADKPILDNSQGKLKYIVLDEAHTLSGSSAAEMALLIKRVIDAFSVDINDVHFAVTSATAGGENHDAIKSFVADLTGKNIPEIEIIEGNRIIPPIGEANNDLAGAYFDQVLNAQNLEEFPFIHEVRDRINTEPALNIDEITEAVQCETILDRLKLIDKISGSVDENGKNLMPIRGHFFIRGINGIYASSNIAVNEEQAVLNGLNITSYQKITYNDFPAYEVAICKSCGGHMLEADKVIENNQIYLKQIDDGEDFDIDAFENDSEPNIRKTYFRRNIGAQNCPNAVNAITFAIEHDGAENLNGDGFIRFTKQNESCCPFCFKKNPSVNKMRLSSSFLNRILAPTILDNIPEQQLGNNVLYEGKRYISFTDSRQGTAKNTISINSDTERNWVRTKVFHLLNESFNTLNQNNRLTQDEEVELTFYLNTPNLPPNLPRRDELIRRAQGHVPARNARISWGSMFHQIYNSNDIEILLENIRLREHANDLSPYAKAIMINEFFRRAKKDNSLETMGLVKLTYGSIDNVNLPESAEHLGIELHEWKSFLKICMDFFIRENYHFKIDPDSGPFLTRPYYSRGLFNNEAHVNDVNVTKWPEYRVGHANQHRLVILLCGGLGWNDPNQINNEQADEIKNLMDKAWEFLSQNLLTSIGPNNKNIPENAKQLVFEWDMNQLQKVYFELCEESYLCPITNRLLDVHFRGISPRINGELSEENIQRYRIDLNAPISLFPFPVFDNKQDTLNWISGNNYENIRSYKDNGIWSDLIEKVLLNYSVFIAGEHSAQQDSARLKELENKFETGQLNILNCSTTMEMGVDIGGISTVVMNNVPPKPANYLQRVGRAGRGGENKALALTFCAPNIIGSMVIKDTKWAMEHEIVAPQVNLFSKRIVRRHINAYFFGKFVQLNDGIAITEKVNDFFFNDLGEGQSSSEYFLNWLYQDHSEQTQIGFSSLVHNSCLSTLGFPQAINELHENMHKIREEIIEKKRNLEDYRDGLGLNNNALPIKAINLQINRLINKNLLVHLVEQQFLPSAGIPTGIVDFDLSNRNTINNQQNNNQDTNESHPSFPISRALREFAPGQSIAKNNWYYESAGIQITGAGFNQNNYFITQLCQDCGFQHIINREPSQNCPQCNSTNFRGVNLRNRDNGPSFTQVIEPAGFAVDLNALPSRTKKNKNHFYKIKPNLINLPGWDSTESPFLDIRENAPNAEILYLNEGRGFGFAVCGECGRTEVETSFAGQNPLNNHKRLRGEGNCGGTDTSKRNAFLGGRFQTDFAELRLKNANGDYVRDLSLLTSLAIVLKDAACQVIGIDENELSYGLKNHADYVAIFLFDTVKGGAGYSNQISTYINEVLRGSKTILEACDCEKACSNCIVNRESQWDVDLLDRHLALDWIDQVLESMEEEAIIGGDLQLGNLISRYNRLFANEQINSIEIFIANKVSLWEIDNFTKLTQFTIGRNIDLVFVVNDELEFESSDDLMTYYQLRSKGNIKISDSLNGYAVTPLVRLNSNENAFLFYTTDENYENIIGNNWGQTETLYMKKFREGDALFNLVLRDIVLPNLPNTQNTFEFYITAEEIPQGNINVQGFYNFIKNKAQESGFDWHEIIQNQDCEVEYIDKYLRSPSGCILFSYFIKSLNESCNVTRLEFKSDNYEDRHSNPRKINHNFSYSDERDAFLENLINDIDNLPELTISNDGILPHFRYLEIKTNTHIITIRPDGGIENGWQPVYRLLDNYGDIPDDIESTPLDNFAGMRMEFKNRNERILYTGSIKARDVD